MFRLWLPAMTAFEKADIRLPQGLGACNHLFAAAANLEFYYRDRCLGARGGHSAGYEEIHECVSESNNTSC
jgi:hypothetical protein